MKRPLIFLLLFLTLLAFSTPTKAQTHTDTIRFTVKPSTEAGATNTLVYSFLSKVENDIRVEWVSGGNREDLTLVNSGNLIKCTQEITAAGQVYIYYSGSSEYGFMCMEKEGAIRDFSVNTNDVRVTSMDVSGCTRLVELLCSGNQLTELDINGCIVLERIECFGNQLETLNVSGCAALTTLWCYANQLTSLDVSSCTALEKLWCQNNQLLSLDVSECTALTTLRCYTNQLTSLDVSECTALTTLWCYANQLTSLDVSECTALTTLQCYTNQLTDLNVSGCTALTQLQCYDNQLTDLDVHNLTALEYLDCGKNSMTILDASDCSALTKVVFSEADTLNLSGCIALTNLQCNYKRLTSLNASGCTSLTSLNCSNNLLTTLDVSNCPALVNFTFNGNIPLTSLNASGCTSLTSLDCSNKRLTSLYVTGCTSLTNLDCSDNQLPTLDVSSCTALDTLDCSFNQLSSLDVSECTALTVLDCGDNQLTDLNVSGCTGLKSLVCWANQLTDLDVSDFAFLETLGCSVNQLTALNVGVNPSLTELVCNTNLLTTLDVSGCTALETLGCYNNQLTSLNVSGCTALKELECWNNQLTVLDLSDNTDLGQLWCADNHLPLSMLYGIYSQSDSWNSFNADPQTDTVTLSACEALNLATEKVLGSAETAFELKDEEGNAVSESAYTEDDFSFTFNDAFAGTLTLQNSGLPDVSMTYHITAEECAAEPPTPTTTKTDTLYFEFALEEWASSAEIEYNFVPAMLPGITMEYYDREAHPKFTPTATGSITVNGNGHGRIYYTYEPGDTYGASFEPIEESTESLQAEDVRRDVRGWISVAAFPDYVRFTSLDVSGCTALTDLWCCYNQQTTLDVSDCMALESLWCYDNQLTSLDVSGCTALTTLLCYDNQLTSLDVSHNTTLQKLYCSNNQLRSLNTSGCTSLTSLDCSNNQLTTLDVSNCPALPSFTFNGNNQLTSLNVSGCTALKTLACRGGQLESLNASGCTSLEGLDCFNNTITSLNVSGCTSLRTMGCFFNQLTTLDVSECIALKVLDCSYNQLTDLNVSDCVSLEELKCNDNHLSELIVSDCDALKRLLCGSNRLEGLDVSGKANLGDLSCSNNQLMDLNINGCTSLYWLYCNNNRLTGLDINGAPALDTLNCSSNHIPLSAVYDLYTQRAWGEFNPLNQTDTVNLSACEALDLATEKTLGGVETAFELKDEADNAVSASAYTEDDFSFTFNEAFTGTLTLQNTSVPDASMTYHITAEECLVETFTVQLSANNGAWGWATQTGNGTYEKDSLVTIIATPAEGYRFVNWTREGEVFSINAVYTFAVTENLTLVANFEEIPEEPVVEETFTVGVYSINEAWGSVSQSGNGTYKKDSLASITATAAEGYRFVNWVRAGLSEAFCTRTDTTFAVTENLVLIASFEKIPDEPEPPVEEGFTITLTPNNPAWGMVFKTGNCVYGEGEEIKILALPYAGYRFVNWTKPDGSVFGTDSLITFKVTESLELIANFEKIPDGPVVKNDLRLDSIPVGMVAPPLLPNGGLPGFPANGYPFENEEMIYTAVFHGDSAVLRLCAGNEVRIALATSGGEGALTYTWTADGGVSVYEENVALDAWPYVTHDSVLVVFFPDSGTHLLNCRITDASGAALDAKVHVSYHTPELLYIEALPKTTTAKYYEGQAVCFQARPQRYADYAWFRVRDRESYAEITDRQLTQEALYHASFKLERPEERHQVWVSVVDRYGCRLWDSAGVELMMMPNVMVLNDPNRPMDGVIFPEFEVEITNVWGMCVKGFSDRNGNGSSRGWDGCTPSGTKVTAGTYYYRVKIPTLDGFVYMPGAVTVINK